MTDYLAAARQIATQLPVANDGNKRVVEVMDDLYLDLMRRFDCGEGNVRTGRSDGMDRRLGRDAGGRIYDVETNGTVLPRSALRGEEQQHAALNEFDRKSEALSKKGYKYMGWVYSEPMEGKTFEKDGCAPVVGKRFEKDGEEHILYTHREKDGADTRSLPAKKIPCSSGCGKDGGKRCSRCNVAMYCSKECQTLHWSEHKHWCVA